MVPRGSHIHPAASTLGRGVIDTHRGAIRGVHEPPEPICQPAYTTPPWHHNDPSGRLGSWMSPTANPPITAGLCALSCAGTGNGASSTAPRLIAGCLHLTGDRDMKGRCPVHQEYMAGRCPVVCVSLRWLHASCAVASAALRPAGRPHVPVTAESWTPRMSRIADVPDRGWCVFAARQLSTGFGGEHWRAVPRGGNGVGGGAACLLVPAAGRQPGQVVELRRGPAGIVPCGAFRSAVAWPLRCAAEPGAVPAFRFVLVSVLRGLCPWLSVRVGGWEPASTDI
jgi:hypothetical protein